ncbi:MAG: transcription-repair coupling factor [Bdellovibrionota bacterium]
MKFEPLRTHLANILHREAEIKNHQLRVVGSRSNFQLALTLLSRIEIKTNNLPHLVITSSLTEAEEFKDTILSLEPHSNIIINAEYDVSPYSGLYPNPSMAGKRLQFISALLKESPHTILITSLKGLLQKTLPFDEFAKLQFELKKGQELLPQIVERLQDMGYENVPYVEEMGHFAWRGGIIDIYSPSHRLPIRIELFGDQIESMRLFNPQTQERVEEISHCEISVPKEIIFSDDNVENALEKMRQFYQSKTSKTEDLDDIYRSLAQKQRFQGNEFFLPFFYEKPQNILDYLSAPINLWWLDYNRVQNTWEDTLQELNSEMAEGESLVQVPISSLFVSLNDIKLPEKSDEIRFQIVSELTENDPFKDIEWRTVPLTDFKNTLRNFEPGGDDWINFVHERISTWKKQDFSIFFCCRTPTQAQILQTSLEKMNWNSRIHREEDRLWDTWINEQRDNDKIIDIIIFEIHESFRSEGDKFIFISSDDMWGAKARSRATTGSEEFQKAARRLNFADLKPGDLIVHIKHGIGQYDGLKKMTINGADSEFIQLSYKDKDKLYLPVYRIGQIQKYSSSVSQVPLDRLGGTAWEKTKLKVTSHIKDIAAELLALYAKRAEIKRDPYIFNSVAENRFDLEFPYEETADQLRALSDIKKDMLGDKPMDRLVCGDVGFGKTEVAMRAAFWAAENKRQVAVLAPTTVLTFQHHETFKKRFANWPMKIEVLNRFVSNSEAKKILQRTKDGEVDILIGTHRILSKDVLFKDLGLLIVDEEQRFGVTHKERVKKLKTTVDTLTLSATPIPRTLNMGLVGIRDLSLINTAPVDRLPTRTFICKFDEDLIRRAVESEIKRSGQIYFIHNRIQSIYGLADNLRRIIPNVRLRVAHGQMPEEELENTMLAFFNHEIDILVCTAIVESGMDVPRANTMFIDQAQIFGLSQLYQLRGRVGRSKLRAYCYLVLPRGKKLEPVAEERLKVIQENTSLGSGIKIAQYDLELRGSGNILGDDQSGHINSVGYELYMDLLNESLAEMKGEPTEDMELDPEINLRVPALISDKYISDIRIRLSYYKGLAEIETSEDLDSIENELKEQFGPIPEETVNLMGLMLIRLLCKTLGVKDVSAGVKSISLLFSEKTRLKPETVIGLASRDNKKYSITPDNRLNIRMNTITWSHVHEEISYLLKLI